MSRLLTEPLLFGVLVHTESGVNTLLPEIEGLKILELPPSFDQFREELPQLDFV